MRQKNLVLIGPGGIFAIDTKTHSKPDMGDPVITYDGDSVLIDGHAPDRDLIKQAEANARFVAGLLAESTNPPLSSVRVRPVVLFPGWSIEGSSSGREVWVLNPKAFVAFLANEGQKLFSEEIGLLGSHLKTRNRNKGSE